MTKKERIDIEKACSSLSDDELEQKYYFELWESLDYRTEEMYELGYDMSDIIEREKYEKYRDEYVDYLEYLCEKRGIELFKEKGLD